MADALPTGATLRDISCHYNRFTIPREMRRDHVLPPEMWGRIVVEEGELYLYAGAGGKPEVLTPAQPGIVADRQPFRLAPPEGAVRFYIEYYHEPRIKDGSELASLLSRQAS